MWGGSQGHGRLDRLVFAAASITNRLRVAPCLRLLTPHNLSMLAPLSPHTLPHYHHTPHPPPTFIHTTAEEAAFCLARPQPSRGWHWKILDLAHHQLTMIQCAFCLHQLIFTSDSPQSPPPPLVHSQRNMPFVLIGRNQESRLRLATVSFEFFVPAEDAAIHVSQTLSGQSGAYQTSMIHTIHNGKFSTELFSSVQSYSLRNYTVIACTVALSIHFV